MKSALQIVKPKIGVCWDTALWFSDIHNGTKTDTQMLITAKDGNNPNAQQPLRDRQNMLYPYKCGWAFKTSCQGKEATRKGSQMA